MSLFSKAAACALLEFPAVNAYLQDDYIEYHNYADISIAVSTQRGLVLPVLRNVQTNGLAQYRIRHQRLSHQSPQQYAIYRRYVVIFTITNGGIFGSLLSTPIINPPQSAILGMHSIQETPRSTQRSSSNTPHDVCST